MSHKENLFKTYLEDMYFMNLGSYNKTQISHKQTFYSDFQDSPQTLQEIFYEILKLLTYNLDFNSSNYRYGQRLFSNTLKDFSWISTNENKTLPISYFDKNDYITKSYDKKMFFTDKEINEHFLSYQSTNRCISFAYNAEYKNELIKKYSESLKNMYKIHKKTYGSSQQLNSNVLLVDIDNRNDISAIETLGLFLDYLNININDLIYIEQNRFTGGIHTALKLPVNIENKDFYSNLENELHNEGIDIECNFINKILRFPLSFEYNPIKKDNKIFGYNEFIPESFFINSLNDFITSLTSFKICESERLLSFIEKYQHIDKKINYWDKKKNLFKKQYKAFFKPTFYKIYNGNRYNTLSKLIPYAKALGYDKEQIIDIIYQNNVDSKDLKKWSKSHLENNINNFYNKCNLKFEKIIKNNDRFISNEHLVPDTTYKFLENKKFISFFVKRFINNYLKERNKHNNGFNNVSELKIQNLTLQMPYFLKEIFGTMYYQINNPKEFIDNKYNQYLGFQLSDTHLSAMQDYINNKLGLDNELKNTSLQYLKKALITSLSLKDIKYNRKRNWMNGCCKSYYIRNNNDIINCLNHLYNSCFYKDIFNLFLSNNDINNLILYILLIENIGVETFNDENILKKIIDIDDS